MRTYTLQITVTAPSTSSENEVTTALNAALDEPPCDWGAWTVGAFKVIDVQRTDA